MQEEADEHYQILVELQKKDKEFDSQLRVNYYRKRDIK